MMSISCAPLVEVGADGAGEETHGNKNKTHTKCKAIGIGGQSC